MLMLTNRAVEQGSAAAVGAAAPPLPVLQGPPPKPRGYRPGTMGEKAQGVANGGLGVLMAWIFLCWPLLAFHAPRALTNGLIFGGGALVLVTEAAALVLGLIGWRQRGSRFAVVVGALFLLSVGSVVLMTELIRRGYWW